MKSFIVLDLSTGAMDGFYTDKEGADMMLPFFNERHPGHMWVVVEVVTSVKGAHIPNDVFHTDKDRKSTRLNSSHIPLSRMPSSA